MTEYQRMDVIKRTEFRGTWGLKEPVWWLAVYAGVLFPALHLLFPPAQQRAWFIFPAYFGVAVLYLITIRRVTGEQLGFHRHHWRQNLILGGLTGGLIIAGVPLLDFFIEASGMDQAELFSGAQHRISDESGDRASFMLFMAPMILFSLAQQGFLTGYVLQALLRKTKPALAVYLGGLIFTLVHFDIQLGLFLLGLITASFYFMTGSLVAPLLFQISCHIAGWLLTHHYPRVFTLLGFLF